MTDATGLDETAFAEQLLAEERVGVVPGTAFGPSGAGHVGVCYATAYEEIVEALDRIERFVGRHPAEVRSPTGDRVPRCAEPERRRDLAAIEARRRDTPRVGRATRRPRAASASTSCDTSLADFQERLWAEGGSSLLVVLQALDAGGKDGLIRKVITAFNPQGRGSRGSWSDRGGAAPRLPVARPCRHARQGRIGIFNRSHYEDVLVVRVKELVPESVWQDRYGRSTTSRRLLAPMRRGS